MGALRQRTTARQKTTQKEEIKVRQIQEDKLKSIQSIKTSQDLRQALAKMNVIEDIDEISDEMAEEALEGIEDDILDEGVDEDLTEYYEETEDDYLDFDEEKGIDPFEGADRIKEPAMSGYVVEVRWEGNKPVIDFLEAPRFFVDDPLIEDALYQRMKIYREMVVFIARHQRGYIKSPAEDNLQELKQDDLVKHIQKKFRLEKAHISRMLDNLFFKINGLGIVSAKGLFRSYWTRRGYGDALSRERKISYAVEFLRELKDRKNYNQLQMAKMFWQFCKDKKGVEIKLSANPRENDKYRNLKNIIKEAERRLKSVNKG